VEADAGDARACLSGPATLDNSAEHTDPTFRAMDPGSLEHSQQRQEHHILRTNQEMEASFGRNMLKN